MPFSAEDDFAIPRFEREPVLAFLVLIQFVATCHEASKG